MDNTTGYRGEVFTEDEEGGGGAFGHGQWCWHCCVSAQAVEETYCLWRGRSRIIRRWRVPWRRCSCRKCLVDDQGQDWGQRRCWSDLPVSKHQHGLGGDLQFIRVVQITPEPAPIFRLERTIVSLTPGPTYSRPSFDPSRCSPIACAVLNEAPSCDQHSVSRRSWIRTRYMADYHQLAL